MTSASYFRVSTVLAAMVAAALLAVVMWHASPASALGTTAVPGTTIVVNTDQDESDTDGDCSLREAITAANTNVAVDGCEAGSAQRDAIHFSLGKQATITLGSTLPTITDTSGLNINGLKSKITVSGDDSVRVFEVGPGAKLTLAHLTVADGSASFGAGLLNRVGTVKVINSTFSGNFTELSGGGIYTLLGTLTVTNSTFSGNSAGSDGGSGGGIAANEGATLRVTNSTFSGNSASFSGGGIFIQDSPATITSSTFSGNSAGSGGAILSHANSTATLRNTILARTSTGGNCSRQLTGTMIDGGYNIDDGTTCGFSAANNSMPSTDPKLASSLANNGGPTQTIALLKGSPAINAIPRATNGCGTEVKTDQRGVKRPQGNKCDISAFEKKVRRR